jgi:hypothetical protein
VPPVPAFVLVPPLMVVLVVSPVRGVVAPATRTTSTDNGPVAIATLAPRDLGGDGCERSR